MTPSDSRSDEKWITPDVNKAMQALRAAVTACSDIAGAAGEEQSKAIRAIMCREVLSIVMGEATSPWWEHGELFISRQPNGVWRLWGANRETKMFATYEGIRSYLESDLGIPFTVCPVCGLRDWFDLQQRAQASPPFDCSVCTMAYKLLTNWPE